MTTATAVDEPAIDFVLPGSWWRVPLDSPETIRRAAQSMTRDWLGRADQLAQARADLAARVVDGAEIARAAAGQDLYLSRELMPGLGMPLTLTVYWPDLPPSPSRAAHPQPAAESLAASLRDTDDPGEVTVLDSAGYGIVRVVTEHQQPPEVRSEDDLGRLLASYWVLNPAAPRPLLMAFSTPLAALREEVLGLTDAITRTVSWRPGP